MSSSIKKNVISVTRGDSFLATLTLTDLDGNEYTPSENDLIRFAVKKTTNDSERILIQKTIPYDTLELYLTEKDTDADPGEYWWDVEVRLSNNMVFTVAGPARFKITEEVGNWRRWES